MKQLLAKSVRLKNKNHFEQGAAFERTIQRLGEILL